ncbi:MAG: DUF169 domain-containing protein [Dehalococcoidales bacterium]|nr:DUF169 domain-containing protein [Dehalococcoidales bacterium]
MTSIEEYNRCGEEIEKYLWLKTSPIAVKMLQKESDIPEGAVRPKRDRGQHLAQCQAFTMSRRQRLTVAMLKEDNWCWGPLVAYGLVDPAVADNFHATKDQAKIMPCFEVGKYIGVLSAPLKTAAFEPDVLLIYGNSAQMRTILLVVKQQEKLPISSVFDPIDSCVYAVVPVVTSGEYRITFPDPGEFQRGLAGEDEVIFSIPRHKICGLASGLADLEKINHGYTTFCPEIRPDFPQPDFYKQLFKVSGLDTVE